MIQGYGVSLYLEEHADETKMQSYLALAKSKDCKEIFTSAHLPEYTLKEQLRFLAILVKQVHRFRMEISVDFGGGSIMEILQDPFTCEAIASLQLDAMRLDYGCNADIMEALHKQTGISTFILNASILQEKELLPYLEKAKEHQIQIKACHNFYPREDTGLDMDFMISQYQLFHKYGIPVIEDAAEGFGSKFDGQVLGTFGKYGVLSFNGNKMITTSGGGALICPDEESKREIMFYATQARESYPYYQHERIGYNYRMSNICAGIGRGQMTVVDEHIAHHKHLCGLYRELLADVEGITLHENPSGRYDSNYWLNTVLLDGNLHVRGEEDAYRETVKGAVGGAAGVTHESVNAHTSCEPNRNVEAMRVCLDKAGIESRPLWKPMHLQPVYAANPAYVNGVSEGLFKRGLCLPSGPYVMDEDVRYIVDEMKNCIL